MTQRMRFLRDACVSISVMTICTAVAAILSRTSDDNNPFATPLYILAVALIARFTAGYGWGIAASVVSVFCVNYIFTYPFFEFDVSIAGYPLTFAAMLLVSVLISALSTQLKRQERLRAEAENEKMRANLLRGISHDIRTPLSAILGASSALLENGELPRTDREELLRGINADARWLIRTTENLLSVTKFSADGVRLKKTEEVVEEIVGCSIVKFHKNNPGMPVAVVKPAEILLAPMDAMLIEQVLINLFENVVAHGERATGITVRISGGDGGVAIAVSDDGAGIAPNILPHLFDGKLSLSGHAHVDDCRNMGIGLSVCSTIIRAHGGEMRAVNNETGGATISFRLPEGGDDLGD